jgi:NADH-quinone oxidoreductase subunit L
VSALIHAATMVVAGVYLVARTLPLFHVADPIALDVVLVLGMITILLSATLGLAATDIKRVIAYSTLNSLGLMFVALASLSVTAAMLYLLAHGFFKAMLFLGSGSVIHATEKQDVNELGGLANKMPITGLTFLLGTLAMIGIFPLAGFWAKDEVLVAVDHEQSVIVYGILLLSLFITGLYMTRLYILTFLFAPKDEEAHHHAHESGLLMTVPLIILAVPTAIAGFVVFPEVFEALGFNGGFGEFVWFEEAEEFKFHPDIAILSMVLAGGGIGVGWILWQGKAELATRIRTTFQPIATLLEHRYYIDELYQWVINTIILGLSKIVAWFDRVVVNDTGVDGSAGLTYFAGFGLKFTQTGRLPNYARAIALGAIALAIIFLAYEVGVD